MMSFTFQLKRSSGSALGQTRRGGNFSFRSLSEDNPLHRLLTTLSSNGSHASIEKLRCLNPEAAIAIPKKLAKPHQDHHSYQG